jgi:hypothetical protein
MYLSDKNLLVFLLEEYSTLSSSSIPQWLLDINQGRVRPKYFSNASSYRNIDKVINLLENVLTSLWLIVTSALTSEMVLDEFKFDEARQLYLNTVRQRMYLVSMLDKVISIGITVQEFPILTDNVVNIKISRTLSEETRYADEIIKNIKTHNIKNSELN